MEQFTLVTEFSRHFYAMLNREGAAAPAPHTAAAEKVIKIVGRLTEYGENLSRKKSSLMAQDRDSAGKIGTVPLPRSAFSFLLQSLIEAQDRDVHGIQLERSLS